MVEKTVGLLKFRQQTSQQNESQTGSFLFQGVRKT